MNDPANPYDDIRDAIGKLCAAISRAATGGHWIVRWAYPAAFVHGPD